MGTRPSISGRSYFAEVRVAARSKAFSAAWGNWTGTKYSSGLKIILARVVNHAELVVLGGGFVGDDLVQLSQLQRCGIVVVIHTHDESELGLCSFHSSVVVVAQNAPDRAVTQGPSSFARDDRF
jgi:hypothetical protein